MEKGMMQFFWLVESWIHDAAAGTNL